MSPLRLRNSSSFSMVRAVILCISANVADQYMYAIVLSIVSFAQGQNILLQRGQCLIEFLDEPHSAFGGAHVHRDSLPVSSNGTRLHRI